MVLLFISQVTSPVINNHEGGHSDRQTWHLRIFGADKNNSCHRPIDNYDDIWQRVRRSFVELNPDAVKKAATDVIPKNIFKLLRVKWKSNKISVTLLFYFILYRCSINFWSYTSIFWKFCLAIGEKCGILGLNSSFNNFRTLSINIQ